MTIGNYIFWVKGKLCIQAFKSPGGGRLVNECMSKHIHCQQRHIWRKSKHSNQVAQIFFFLGTSPNPAHAGDRLPSESSLGEIPALSHCQVLAAQTSHPWFLHSWLQTPERSPLWKDFASLLGSCMMRVVGTGARGWDEKILSLS